jgi:excisionase family DNA binding protein
MRCDGFNARVPDRTPFGTRLVPGPRPERRVKGGFLLVPQSEVLLTLREVARQLGVCRATVYRLCATDKLPSVRVCNALRVRPADLIAFASPSTKRGSGRRP